LPSRARPLACPPRRVVYQPWRRCCGGRCSQSSASPFKRRQRAKTIPCTRIPFIAGIFGGSVPAERQILAAGSGVVIDADRGLVLTNIVGPAGGNVGIGFAIPSNMG